MKLKFSTTIKNRLKRSLIDISLELAEEGHTHNSINGEISKALQILACEYAAFMSASKAVTEEG